MRLASSHSKSASGLPKVVSLQEQQSDQQENAGRANRPRTNTEFQQFLLMQDGIKQIQNAIKNKLSLYFTEIKEFSNF